MSIALKGKEVNRYFNLHDALFEFHKLFTNNKSDDRTIAILGGTFLEMVLEHILLAFLPEDKKEVEKIMQFNQPLGSFSNKFTMIYCLGLVDKMIKDDLNLIRKIRNEFAPDLYASFDSDKIKSWCTELKWYKVMLTPTSPVDAAIKDYFQVGVNTLINHLHGCVGIVRQQKLVIIDNF